MHPKRFHLEVLEEIEGNFFDRTFRSSVKVEASEITSFCFPRINARHPVKV